ncbi:MAG TPA: hypothetical protein VK658_00800 [Chryseolinea sp.]|nr:hypothetical protein [Chryseolinea sp.]
MTRAVSPSLKLCWQAVFALAGAVLVTSVSAQEYITLTKGGGVTGNTTSFRISRSGEVAKGSGSIEPAFSEFAQLRKGKAKKYFRKTRALMKEQTFNHPGNTYTALALVEGGSEGKLVWGDATHETPVKAVKLYQKIQASLNRLTFRKELRK